MQEDIKMTNDETPSTTAPSVLPPTASENKTKNRRYWWFLTYLAPVLVVVVVAKSIQVWVVGSCTSLPKESQGECGVGWLQLLFVPATYAGVVIAWLVVFAGILHLSLRIASRQTTTSKVLLPVLGVLLAISSLFGGIFVSINYIF